VKRFLLLFVVAAECDAEIGRYGDISKQVAQLGQDRTHITPTNVGRDVYKAFLVFSLDDHRAFSGPDVYYVSQNDRLAVRVGYRQIENVPEVHLLGVTEELQHLDDADQGITHIVRGSDLLESTFAHWHLQTVLSLPHPHYAHLPVIVNADGQKLSKQTHAEPIPLAAPAPYLMYCLQTLGQQPPATLNGASAHSILQWACEHWQLERVPPARYLPQQQIR